jgi:hypothetical protein
MTRNWKALGLAALLAAAVCAPQARPADPEKPNSVQDQLKDIHAALQQMNQNFQHMANDLRDMGVRGARAAQEIRDLQDRVSLIEQELRSQRRMLSAVQAATQDVRDLQDRLALAPRPALPGPADRQAFSFTPTQDLRNLEERLAALEARLNSDERRFSFTPEAPARRTGTLRLENHSPYEATFTVNGNPYPVPAFATRLVQSVPAGPFTFEIAAEGFGVIRPATTGTVSAGATRVLFVNP